MGNLQSKRKISQLGFLVITFFLLGAIAVYCPLGAIQRLAGAIVKTIIGEWPEVKNIIGYGYVMGFFGLLGREILLITLFLIFIVFIGRTFCGWICPFGTILALIGRINLPIEKRMPPKILIDKGLKYEILIVLILAAGFFGYPIFCQICPAGVIYKTIGGQIRLTYALYTTFILLGIAVLTRIFYTRRFWCKSFCPLGALLAIFDRFSMLKIRVDKEKCVGCLMCQEVCPMDVRLIQESKFKNIDLVNSPECIRCCECVQKCGRKALKFP
jgi:NapH/MauN family ferredoxin-type protein